MPTDTAEPATGADVLPVPSEAPASEGTQPPAAETAAPASAQEAPATEAPNFRDVWKGMSPQERAEYLKETPWEETFGASDWLKGKVGAQKQRTEREQREYEDNLKAQWQAERDAAEEARRLREAVKNDDAYAALEILKPKITAQEEQEQRTVAEQQEAIRLEQYAGSRLGQVAVAAFEQLPDEVKAALKAPDGSYNRHWAGDGTAEGGLAEAIKTAIDAGVKAELKKASPTLRREIEAAVRAEMGVTGVAAMASPDTRGTAAEAVTTDTEFLAAYAAGRSGDHVRARKLLGLT